MRLFSDPGSQIENPWMRRAYELAERGRGATSPNPLVGCVVVREGAIAGEGWHERAGGPHAEVVALQDAGDAAREADVFVTLEPCSHHGRTPPCTEALAAAGVRSVHVGMRDPNPDVQGDGAGTLLEAGISISFEEGSAPYEEQNEAWLSLVTKGRPWVDVKVALTLDGRPALGEGIRTRITGAGGAQVTSLLRSAADAVVVGASTAVTDSPSLLARDSEGRPLERQPIRVVLARDSIPGDAAKLFPGAGARKVVLLEEDSGVGELASLGEAGMEVVTYPGSAGLRGALSALAREGVARVLVEAGPRLFTALWESELIDRLYVLHAGGIGWPGAPSLFGGGRPDSRMELNLEFEPVEAGTVQETAVTVWRRMGPPK